MTNDVVTPTQFVRRQLNEHEWRDHADNDWWHGYLAALRDVLAASAASEDAKWQQQQSAKRRAAQ